MVQIKEKLVVITGAASGIGQALAQLYFERGWKVAGIDVSTHEGSQYIMFQADVSNEREFRTAAGLVFERFGRPDLWINNAGIVKLSEFANLGQDEFDRVMNVNFRGVVIGTRIAMEQMVKPVSGTIVNIGSVSGMIPAPFMTSYVASKHAVIGFTRSLQEELIQLQSPLKLILINPGFVKTPIMESQNGFEFPKWLQKWVEDAPTTAKEIARIVEAKESEGVTSLNGRLLAHSYRLFPFLTRKSSRLLTAKNWKELLGLKPIRQRTGKQD
ncbi:MAG: SDR family oxidoreductase [Oligoflexia bacterium]|nr:SDR family oxidoreductase [Oligoflexia bacterium]